MNTELLLLTPVVYLLLVGLPIVVSDFRVARVPNKYTLPALYIWLIVSITHAVVSGEWIWSLVMPIVFGLLTMFIGVYFSGRGVIGMGDVKLITFMGLTLSWKFAWVWLIIPAGSLLIGLLVAVFHYFARTNATAIRLAPAIYLVYLVLIATLFLN